MHPHDERALKLTRAFQTYNLDQITAMLGHALHRPAAQVRTNLRPVFTQAQTDKLNLLSPPADFHTWLQEPLRITLRGPGTARSNTVIARHGTLSRMYTVLMEEGLLTSNPAQGCPLPGSEFRLAPLPSAGEVRRLLAEARELNDVLYAALTLIYRHAFQITELLELRWTALDFSRGELLRARLVASIVPETLQALTPLLSRAGGPLHAEEQAERVFPFENPDALRLEFWKTCKRAGLSPFGPRELRLAGIRDHRLPPQQAGFSNPQAYARALRQAEALVVQTRP